MKIPNHLKHKPVIVVENYDQIDGRWAGDTDAMGLSLGLAQWNERGNVDISAKVWRHTDKKWSRQSEELPLHRILDLAILILETKKQIDNSSLNSENTKIPLQEGEMTVSLLSKNENPNITGDLKLFEECWKNKEMSIIDDRLEILKKLLNNI